jgi:hypothetical protein
LTHLVRRDSRFGVEDKSDNESVKTQDFGENENENLGILSVHVRVGFDR